jgi:regulator of cell morphogenesis and NO signaling
VGDRLGPSSDAALPDLDALTARIVRAHHAYVRASGPELRRLTEELDAEHGGDCPAFATLRGLVRTLVDEITVHLSKEENLLFPYIDELAAARRAGDLPPISPFGSLVNPIRVMEANHRQAFELVAQIDALTATIAEPRDAARKYGEYLDRQMQFNADLRRHVHLEQQTLFPRAIDLEQQLQ